MIKKTLTLMIVVFIIFSFSSNAFSYTPSKGSAPWVGADLSGIGCTGKGQGPGPYDYIIPSQKAKLPIVEKFHFTPEIENLMSRTSIDGLDYTLRASPNHHKALLSLIRYQLRLNNKLSRRKPSLTPVECYFQRAMNFSPKDAATLSLYAYYLKKINRLKESAKFYEKALKITPNNAKVHYSYSLLLIDLKQYDKAVNHAKKAYEQGNPPLSLKKKLHKLGKWQD